jgi:hypothetical protein
MKSSTLSGRKQCMRMLRLCSGRALTPRTVAVAGPQPLRLRAAALPQRPLVLLQPRRLQQKQQQQQQQQSHQQQQASVPRQAAPRRCVAAAATPSGDGGAGGSDKSPGFLASLYK